MTAVRILVLALLAQAGQAEAQRAPSSGPAKMIVLGSEGGVAVTQFASMAGCRRAEAFLAQERENRIREQQEEASRMGGAVAKYRPVPLSYCVPEQ